MEFDGINEEVFEEERDPQFDDFPQISEGLIAAIKTRMPERWPNAEMPDRQIWIRAGMWRVVELLEYVLQEQVELAKKGHLNVHRQ